MLPRGALAHSVRAVRVVRLRTWRAERRTFKGQHARLDRACPSRTNMRRMECLCTAREWYGFPNATVRLFARVNDPRMEMRKESPIAFRASE